MELWSAQFLFCSTAIQTPPPTHPPRWNGGWWLVGFGGEGFPVARLWSTMSVAYAENSPDGPRLSDRVLRLRKSIDNCAFTCVPLEWVWWWFRLWMLIFFFLSTRFAEYQNNTKEFFLAQEFLPLNSIMKNILFSLLSSGSQLWRANHFWGNEDEVCTLNLTWHVMC